MNNNNWNQEEWIVAAVVEKKESKNQEFQIEILSEWWSKNKGPKIYTQGIESSEKQIKWNQEWNVFDANGTGECNVHRNADANKAAANK